MGSYNGEGCISGLPIESGDPIGGIICVSTKDYSDNEMITPVWPIIWGHYDDYGGIDLTSVDSELEEYFGNRKNLLRDLERVTHDCRHQIEDGIPEDICLLIEHEDVLKTIITQGNPKTIEESFKAGQPMYRLNFKPSGFQCRGDNIYHKRWSYFDNDIFLKCFRNYCKGNLPQNKQEAYFDTIAFYMSLYENCIFLKWQRFAGWQHPGRKSAIWKKLTSVYKKLTR